MKVGVICEGPTGFYAISEFFGELLKSFNIEASFVDIQPTMDNTRANAGWGHVFLWLKNNTPNTRIHKYLGSGLFSHGLSAKVVDVLLIQIDTDILENESFQKYIEKNYDCIVTKGIISPDERALEIEKILSQASGLDQLSEEDKNRHIICPAVESTEAWCICVFKKKKDSYRNLSGQELINQFGQMYALYMENKKSSQTEYSTINKDPDRRLNFCRSQKINSKSLLQNFPEIKNSIKSLKLQSKKYNT